LKNDEEKSKMKSFQVTRAVRRRNAGPKEGRRVKRERVKVRFRMRNRVYPLEEILVMRMRVMGLGLVEKKKRRRRWLIRGNKIRLRCSKQELKLRYALSSHW
jgi:hypothetical protein